jgi:multidrug efflux pump subunit AcrA (membrane-fusion protein)
MSALTRPVPAPGKTQVKPGLVAKPEPPRQRRFWIAGSLLLTISIGGLAAYQYLSKASAQAPAGVAVKTARAIVAPLNVTLRMTGQTSARNFINVTTPVLRGPEARGSLTLLYVAPSGSKVKKGDLLVKIDAESAQDHIDDLRDTVESAQNDIRKRQAEQAVEMESLLQTVRLAKANFEKARLEYRAAEVRTAIERELLKLTMDEAEARYKQQLGNVEQRKAVHASERRILEITLDRHKRHVGRHEHDIAAFTLKSPIEGLVVMNTTFRGGQMVQLQQGDPLMPGMPILKVVDMNSMQVEGSVNQSDSSDLRLNQRVRIGLDAFADVRFEGRIYSVGALASGGFRSGNYIRTVPVRVTIEGADSRLIPDLSAHCDVVLETLPNQLQVPLAAIHRQEDGKATVAVKEGDSWEERAVTLGKRSHTMVAVTSGVEAGDEVRLTSGLPAEP